MYSVVGTGGGGLAERIGDADCVRGVHQGGDLGEVGPADFHGLGTSGAGISEWGAAEDQGHDTASEILVDTGEAFYADVHAGFFADFAADAFLELLVEFEDAAGWFPVSVVAALDYEDLVSVVNDDSGDADRVSRSVGHPITSLLSACGRIVPAQTCRRVALAVVQLGEIDKAADRPPYRQIAAALREAITAGRLAPGDRLPSESELVERYDVARMTARQAIQELRTEGLVVSEHGRGVFVRSVPVVRRLASERFARRHREQGKAAFSVEAETTGYTASVDRIKVYEGPAPAEIAERLGLAAGDTVVIRDRRYLANNEPVEIAVSYVPVDLARGTAIA